MLDLMLAIGLGATVVAVHLVSKRVLALEVSRLAEIEQATKIIDLNTERMKRTEPYLMPMCRHGWIGGQCPICDYEKGDNPS